MLLLGAPSPAAPESSDAMLQRADRIKRTDNPEFQSLLRQLDAGESGMTASERDWLGYLHAWQAGYQGHYARALAQFQTLLARTRDPTVQTRARVSMIDAQLNSRHLEDAYANVHSLLEALPQITDHEAHFLVLASASSMYVEAGQYDLALQYADQALAYDHSDLSTCITISTKAEALQRSGKLQLDDAWIRDGIDACQNVNEVLFGSLIRLAMANTLLERGDATAALRLLLPHDSEVLASGSSALIPRFRVVLATAAMRTGNASQAEEYARSALDHSAPGTTTEASADAWHLLYQIARKQGDDRAALEDLERYAVAAKAHLNDVSATALAYQMVAQQDKVKKAQIASLDRQNQLLLLEREADAKRMLAVRLGVALLVLLLASIAVYALRTRRAQRKFRDLARRDGLTGICNRQHFMERAALALATDRKASRPSTLVTIDLDHFKRINDDHGHAAGDDALRRVVVCCKEALRSTDIFGRLGGEEFAIMMPNCQIDAAANTAEAIRRRIASLHDHNDGPAFPLSASFGVVGSAGAGHDLATLLAKADLALYQAKRTGRNQVIVHAGH